MRGMSGIEPDAEAAQLMQIKNDWQLRLLTPARLRLDLPQETQASQVWNASGKVRPANKDLGEEW